MIETASPAADPLPSGASSPAAHPVERKEVLFHGFPASPGICRGRVLVFGAAHVVAHRLTFSGKYSFQYVCDAEISDSDLNTKDAFWHTKNVTVRDSVIRGEYLGWYSETLTLIRCKIIGTQPLCYCRNLTLIDCETEGCDLSFEYSSVNATVRGGVLSIKNPLSGRIVCDAAGEIILRDSVYPSRCEIIVGGERLNHL